MATTEQCLGLLDEIDDPGCREFSIGEGDWPFRGFVVRQGDQVYAYQNVCTHAGHALNWKPDGFLTKDNSAIICASHGAMYDIPSGQCIAGPGRGALRAAPVEVRDGVVYVSEPVNT